MTEASKIANFRRLVAVNDGLQSEPTDGLTSGWRQRSVVEVVVAIVADMYLYVVVVVVVVWCIVV